MLIAAAKRSRISVGVRLPKDFGLTKSILAIGVDSVTFPGVESGAEAADLVGWCTGGSATISMQIETRRGLEHAPEIARVDGVDVLHCGRSDLARSLELPKEGRNNSTLDAAEDSILIAAAHAGKLGAMHWPPGADNLDRVRRWVTDGIAWLTLGAETQILRAALSKRFHQASGHSPNTNKSTDRERK